MVPYQRRNLKKDGEMALQAFTCLQLEFRNNYFLNLVRRHTRDEINRNFESFPKPPAHRDEYFFLGSFARECLNA